MCMRYVSIQQTIRYSICKISDIACGPPFWIVLVSQLFSVICWQSIYYILSEPLNNYCTLNLSCESGHHGLVIKADSTHAGSPGLNPGASRKKGSHSLLSDRKTHLNWSTNRGSLYHYTHGQVKLPLRLINVLTFLTC